MYLLGPSLCSRTVPTVVTLVQVQRKSNNGSFYHLLANSGSLYRGNGALHHHPSARMHIIVRLLSLVLWVGEGSEEPACQGIPTVSYMRIVVCKILSEKHSTFYDTKSAHTYPEANHPAQRQSGAFFLHYFVST